MEKIFKQVHGKREQQISPAFPLIQSDPTEKYTNIFLLQ